MLTFEEKIEIDLTPEEIETAYMEIKMDCCPVLTIFRAFHMAEKYLREGKKLK